MNSREVWRGNWHAGEATVFFSCVNRIETWKKICPMDVSARSLLKQHFGFDAFRPMQEEVVDHVLSGRDAFVVMPTGSGKSLCYQFPALLRPGVTLVVSPLIALMKDQVDALRANGIAAAFVNSSMPREEIQVILEQARRGEWRLLYIAPERLASLPFQEILRRLPIDLIAIDEAHCISEWGHDFRPDYRNLSFLRQLFPTIPWIALTATANPRVQKDVLSQLKLEQGKLFLSSFNRPNLTYVVQPKRSWFESLTRALEETRGSSAIIYCFSRKDTERLAERLRQRGFEASPYHAGLSDEVRRKTQERFIRDACPIIVATIAFGMGIDKPNVRLVAHVDLPRSVEAYYQETGRAGRDGLPSRCLFFYSAGDRWKREFFIRDIGDEAERARARTQLDQMMRYAETKGCRRKFLLEYFGETWPEPSCGACDTCLGEQTFVAPASMVAADVDHGLFERLRLLRRQKADERGVPPYVIASDRTLLEMSRLFPQSLESLANIHGVGREKLKTLGTAFIQAIREHLACAGDREDLATDKPPSDTLLQTKELVEQKLPIQDIARRRKLALTTILSHLEQLSAQETVDLEHLKPPAPRLNLILKTFRATGNSALSPVRARLGNEYSYEELRLARLFLKTPTPE
jgi:RecQ family ATP-dependent DNA helicase